MHGTWHQRGEAPAGVIHFLIDCPWPTAPICGAALGYQLGAILALCLPHVFQGFVQVVVRLLMWS